MTNDKIPKEIELLFESMIEKIVDESIKTGTPPIIHGSLWARVLSAAAAGMGVSAPYLAQYVSDNGVKLVHTYFLGKKASSAYSLPLPPIPGAALCLPLTPFSGFDTMVFKKEGDTFETQKIRFPDISILEQKAQAALSIDSPPEIETLERVPFNSDFKFLGAKISPYFDNNTCLLVHANSEVPDFFYKVSIARSVMELYRAHKKGGRTDEE